MNDTGDMRIGLLLFSVFGVHFGVAAEQVAGITRFDGAAADDLFWFHKELEFDDASPTYAAPMVATIRTGCVQSYRVIIDRMEDIAEYSQSDIRLFPELMEPFALRRGLWGILLRNKNMVLLVDFQRLLQGKRSDYSDAEPEPGVPLP